MAIYSASVEDSAIAFCLELDQDTKPENMKIAYPETLFPYTTLFRSRSKQKATALSSTEAEYMAITHVSKESLWIKLFC